MNTAKPKIKSYPTRKADVPATQKMLYLVRDQLDAKVEKSKHELKADIQEIKSELHRVALLVEEQNARNAIVMDGLTSLFARQERLERERDV